MFQLLQTLQPVIVLEQERKQKEHNARISQPHHLPTANVTQHSWFQNSHVPPKRKKHSKTKTRALTTDMFASDRDARLYAACAEGNIAGIQNYITSSSSMLPIGALNLAIYHLKMEAVNYLVSSGLVDPNEEGPVPLRLLQHAPVGDKSKSGLYETDDSSKYLYGPVPLYRALSVAELERSRTPYKLVSFMHDRLSVEANTETAREACTFMKTWLRPKKGPEMKEVNKPWMDLQTVKHVFNESNRTQLFDEERGIHISYNLLLKQ